MCPNAKDGDPCATCTVEKLDAALSTSRAGELIRAALDIDFAKQSGITLGADDVSCEEFKVLRMIQLERGRWMEEQREQQQREHEAEKRKAR